MKSPLVLYGKKILKRVNNLQQVFSLMIAAMSQTKLKKQ